ncbi:hypothetical protein E5F05_16000 [Deinococcus metallilatus]|uniref:Uncharacterized protein n=1 Tax=Deinococcus metallilatus TaxID=1211322 RepID=A0AAJ5F5T0_9DEIO|nr:hypothetical protein [Deinococcus metallilatus]MBB5294991.1 hypothetical protein [Deinococcus metallilatus]QBY09316.1 hypothetical protein E5F05_16000 [Deinococcus metallilatus]RXJ09321.1 hypothetical protein ERJ73_14835 [Deinococcus metallilatus]TLK28843.1 hypothetical protein FCS05_06600 [Deinococcus metallilatus]GMA16923.1 hypothetical protein GCM10025871_32540 [Deinococcus metallilatus]
MGQPQTLRRLNRQQVLRALLGTQVRTRPQFAEQLGLSKVTVTAIVRELLECGPHTLADRLQQLQPGVALSLPQDASGTPLQGAVLLARQRAQEHLLKDALHWQEARSCVA